MANETCSYEWASLPPSRYGQPVICMENALKNFEKYLKNEQSGKHSPLHLQNGFLKLFGY